MRRKDGKKIPVAFIPNGTGDDTCGSFGIDIGDINQALEFLIKGNTIKVDVIKILIDFESENEIIDSQKNDESILIENHLRYSIINTSLCTSANCSKNAQYMKQKIGSAAYTIQTVIEVAKRRQEKFDILIDKKSFLK